MFQSFLSLQEKLYWAALYLGHICILLQKFWQTLSDEFSMRNPTLQGAWAGNNIEFVAVVVELHLFPYIRKEKAGSHWWSPSSMIQQDIHFLFKKHLKKALDQNKMIL